MGQFFKQILITVIGIYAFMQAVHYGGIWESQAHPTPNVTIRAINAPEAYTGNLSREWTGRYTLTTQKSEMINFTPETFIMEFPVNNVIPSQSVRWREFYFPIAVIMFFITLSLWTGTADKRQNKKG